MAASLETHEFPLSGGRILILIENKQTQSMQITIRKGRKRILTTTLSVELGSKNNSTNELS